MINQKYVIVTFVVTAFLAVGLLSNGHAETIDPSTDIAYLGAFRLPADTTGGQYGWEYGLYAMTYYPEGDPDGGGDGTPGSLFVTNHTYEQYVAEISIPTIVNSKDLSTLNRAGTLQNFHDINQGTYSTSYIESEIAYLPKQGAQTTDKLYISWNDWYNPGDEDLDRFGWCELTLSSPNTQGPWNLGDSNADVMPHTVGEYLFEIPASWAALNTPGKLLVTGKYREGGSNDGGVRFGGGPAMYAFGPWGQGNPPSDGTALEKITLLSYVGGHVWSCPASGDVCKVMDRWEGGAWVVAGTRNAVILTGRKGFGEDYYGDVCNSHGYHNLGGYKPYMLFYDPADLADVAKGEKQPYDPQPYATLDCGDHAFHSSSECSDGAGFRSCAYDRENQLLYVAEPNVDGAKAVIHVFKIKTVNEMKSPTNLRIVR